MENLEGVDVVIITGTGIKISLPSFTKVGQIPYEKFNLPQPTTTSHNGFFEIFEGHLKKVVIANGRVHAYEGLDAASLRALPALVCSFKPKLLILTNSTGGLNPYFKKGDIMLIKDHINLSGANPLIGLPQAQKFVDMNDAYSQHYIQMFKDVALSSGVEVKEGVYVAVCGPSLETPAETRFLRLIGADAVAMSLVNETIVGRFYGVEVLGISIITNVNKPDCMGKIPLSAVIEAAISSSSKLSMVLDAFLKNDIN